MSSSIGAYEAKTHLPRLLDKVEHGESITITKHGRPVARLVPPDPDQAPTEEVILALLAARKGVRRGRVAVRRMIAEGRR
jgi:prevent-host-death family protein